MTEPTNPLSGAVWRRGARLGMQWLAIFVIVTAGLYGVLGAFGWSGTWRALCAMGAGPIVGTGIIAAWWVLRRPSLIRNGDASEKT